MKKEILLVLLIITFIWIGIIIRDGFRKLPQLDCQFMIPAYQHQLEKEIEELKWEEESEYDNGWNGALENVLNLIK